MGDLVPFVLSVVLIWGTPNHPLHKETFLTVTDQPYASAYCAHAEQHVAELAGGFTWKGKEPDYLAYTCNVVF